MRIRIVTGIDPEGFGIADSLASMLVEELGKQKDVVISDENPDVIHIIGGWNAKTRTIAKDAEQKFITLIHTPLGSLSPWFKPMAATFSTSAKAVALVASGEMERELLDDGSRQNLTLIPNAVTTVSITPGKMAEHYLALYEETRKMTDEKLWKTVKDKIQLINEPDETIRTLAEHFLYAHYLYQRNNIPLSFITKLSAMMKDGKYDEDHLMELLKLIKLNVFTQQLEFVIKERTSLTEGFMPVMWKEDKVANNMLKLITEYDQ